MTNAIRENRLRLLLTQDQLARLVRVSRQTINAIETHRYQPSTVLALKLARALQQPVELLFCLTQDDE